MQVAEAGAGRADPPGDPPDQGRVRSEQAVVQPAPDQPGAEHPGGGLLLEPAGGFPRAGLSAGHHEHRDGVPGRRVGQQGGAAAELDVVGVRPDREDAAHRGQAAPAAGGPASRRASLRRKR